MASDFFFFIFYFIFFFCSFLLHTERVSRICRDFFCLYFHNFAHKFSATFSNISAGSSQWLTREKHIMGDLKGHNIRWYLCWVTPLTPAPQAHHQDLKHLNTISHFTQKIWNYSVSTFSVWFTQSWYCILDTTQCSIQHMGVQWYHTFTLLSIQ